MKYPFKDKIMTDKLIINAELRRIINENRNEIQANRSEIFKLNNDIFGLRNDLGQALMAYEKLTKTLEQIDQLIDTELSDTYLTHNERNGFYKVIQAMIKNKLREAQFTIDDDEIPF